MNRLIKISSSQINNAPLIVFRIIFGLLMALSIARFYFNDWIQDIYLNPDFHFKYPGFGWIDFPSESFLYIVFSIAFLSAIGIMLGLFYRISALLFFLSYTYIELLDATIYLNHYYLISLVAFWMIWLPAGKRFSLDLKIFKKQPHQTCAAWNINLIKFQIAIVYFFAGVAKINPDWLFQGLPVKIWMMPHSELPVVGKILTQDFTAYFFSWFGCVYDLLIAFFMLSYRTQKIAYIFVLLFHLATAFLFNIGLFPYIMICITLIFFRPQFHDKVLKRLGEKLSNAIPGKKASKVSLTLIGIYCVIQLLLPVRHFFYEGNVLWTEMGYRFSWRVKLISKNGNATFYVQDRETKRRIEINNLNYLTPIQNKKMSVKPEYILQYAHFLHETFDDTLIHAGQKTYHLINPEIYAEVYVSFNGRASKMLINPNVDLAKINRNQISSIIINKGFPFN